MSSSSREPSPSASGVVSDLLEVLKDATLLLGRCQTRLEAQEGLNRSGLRLHLTTFLESGVVAAAIAKAENR